MKKIIMLIFCLSAFSLVDATDFYVSTSGDDNNDGSFENPWKTAKFAIESLEAGDNLYFRGGFYPLESRIIIRNSGRSNNWIKILAYADEVPVIDATNADISTNDAIIMASKKNFIHIEGIHIQNSTGGGFLFTECDSIHLMYNATFQTFNSGIRFAGNVAEYVFCKGVKIIGNYIYKPNYYALIQPGDNRTKAPHEGITIGRVDGFECAYNELCYGDKEGIDCKGPTRNGTIHHNHIHHQLTRPFTVAIYLDAWSDDSIMNIEVHDNILYKCDDGVQVQSEDGRDVVDIYVHNNLIFDMGWSGIGASNNSPDKSSAAQDGITQNVYFWNNTVHDTNDAVWLHGEIRNIYFYNNILSSPRNSQIDNGDGIDFLDKNIVFEKNMFHTGITIEELTNMGISDNYVDNPHFQNVTGIDYHLTASSPAIGTGKTDFEFADDKDIDLGFYPFGDYLQLTTPHLLIDYDENESVFDLITNREDISLVTTEDWITAEYSDGVIVVTTLDNTHPARRKANITISAGEMETKITLFQKAYYPVEELKILNCPESSFEYRDRYDFEYSFEPYYATIGQEVERISSNSEIAEFYNTNSPDKIIINGGGEATITYSADEVSDQCTIKAIPSSVEKESGNNVKLFPTMVEDNSFRIINNSKFRDGIVYISDLRGKRIFSEELDSEETLIQPDFQLSPGFYFVSVSFSKKVLNYRIIVK
jgi:hypothetical protein